MRYAALMSLTFLVLSIVSVHAEQEKGTPRPQKVRGTLSRLDGTSLTVTSRGDSGEKQHPFTVDDATKVLIEGMEDIKVKIKGEGGEREVVRPKTTSGKIGDLKIGQQLTITHVDGKAREIQVHRLAVPKKEGER